MNERADVLATAAQGGVTVHKAAISRAGLGYVNAFIWSRSLPLDDRATSSTAVVEDIQQRSAPMFPFEVDPGWHENYWYSDRPRPQQRRAFSGNVARFAVLVLLLAGSGVVFEPRPRQGQRERLSGLGGGMSL